MWRRFNFWERHAVEAPRDLLKHTWPCAVAGEAGSQAVGALFFGGNDGTLAVVEAARLRPVAGWRAHETRVTHLVHCNKLRNVLVTVGEDDANAALASTTVKIWDVERLVLDERDADAPPPLQRAVKLFAPKFPEAPVLAFAASEDGAAHVVLAAGLATGHVYVLRQDLSRDRVARLRVLMSSDSSPVQGVGLRMPVADGGGAPLVVYAATRTAVTSAEIASWGAAYGGGGGSAGVPPAPRVAALDSHGAPSPRCTAVTERGEFVVARPEGVYFYTPDGRGACLALPGDKRHVLIKLGVMVLISALQSADTTPPPAGAAALAGSNSRSGGAPPGGSFTSGDASHSSIASTGLQLSVYDLRSKLCAYQGPLGDAAHVIQSAHAVTVLSHDGVGSFRLRERDTATKVELLVKRGLYPTALNLLSGEEAACLAARDARAAAAASAAAAEVRRAYGEHLYSKRDFDGALAQYIAAIGSPRVPPSTVIRLFLEAGQLTPVVTYLEALHAAGGAAPEHTTLLLHCYAAERDPAKLDAFLAGTSGGGGSGAPEEGDSTVRDSYRARFDVDTVMRVCRAAGYPRAALGVATRAGAHAARMAIMLDDLAMYDEALSFLDTLPPNDAEQAIHTYGRRLLAARPDATVAALLRGCSRARGAAGLARAAGLVPIFAEHPRQLLFFLQSVLDACGRGDDATVAQQPAVAAVYNTLLELLLTDRVTASSTNGDTVAEPNSAAAVVGSARSSAAPTPSIPDADARAAAALRFLREAWPAGGSARYDPSHALVMCQTKGHRPGTLFLYERLGMFTHLLRAYMDAGDARGLLDAASRLGARQPGLWKEVLEYFGRPTQDATDASTSKSSEAMTAAVREALGHVERGRLLPPVVVLNTLARNPRLPLAVVKDYVRRALAEDTAAAAEDAASASKAAQETQRMRAELKELRTSARVFTNNRCALCTQALDLPAAHFMCMHSFHARCLGDADAECPVCAPEKRSLDELRNALAAAAADQDRFYQALENSDDGFAVIAEHMGRGLV